MYGGIRYDKEGPVGYAEWLVASTLVTAPKPTMTQPMLPPVASWIAANTEMALDSHCLHNPLDNACTNAKLFTNP